MLSVLIVDDDPDLRLLTRRMLSRLDCEVVEAINGADGELKALTLCPELVFLDIMMPDRDGFETCKQLRAQGFSGRVILLSAMQETSISDKLAQCGADAYLQKPIVRETLRKHVEQARTF